MIGEPRAFETSEPRGEIAVAQRPNQPVKLVHYPTTGEKTEIVMEKDKAFNFATEIRQQVIRLG
jgi:hypothetical protein